MKRVLICLSLFAAGVFVLPGSPYGATNPQLGRPSMERPASQQALQSILEKAESTIETELAQKNQRDAGFFDQLRQELTTRVVELRRQIEQITGLEGKFTQ